MKIVKCPNCNRLIHTDRACFFCGNSENFVLISEAEVHENARDAFVLAEMQVAQGQFENALTSLYEVMKWSPNSPEVHWLLMLAQSHCRTDRELFYSGLYVTELPDYDTALRYASEDEKTAYSAVGNACEALRKTLHNMVAARNKMAIEKLKLEETLSKIQQFIGSKRSVLLAAWQELRKCEQEMKLLENEGLYYIHECNNNMQEVRAESSAIRSGLENTSELERKQYFVYKLKLESLKKAAEAAKDEFYRLKTSHPSVAAFTELSQKRDELLKTINTELSAIKTYEQSVEAVISQMNNEKKEGTKLLGMVDSGSYQPVISVLGQNNYERAVRYALSIK